MLASNLHLTKVLPNQTNFLFLFSSMKVHELNYQKMKVHEVNLYFFLLIAKAILTAFTSEFCSVNVVIMLEMIMVGIFSSICCSY